MGPGDGVGDGGRGPGGVGGGGVMGNVVGGIGRPYCTSLEGGGLKGERRVAPGGSGRELKIKGWKVARVAGSWERVGLGRLKTEVPRHGSDWASEGAAAVDLGSSRGSSQAPRWSQSTRSTSGASRPEVGAQAVEPVGEAGRVRRSGHLRDGEGVEVDHCDPPRESVADGPREHEVLRAGQQPAAGLTVGVDVVLYVVEELRLVLNLVEDHAVARVREEPDGVVAGDVPHVRALQRQVTCGRRGTLWGGGSSCGSDGVR